MKSVHILHGKCEGKVLVGRLSRAYKGNIKADVKQIEYDSVDCVCLSQNVDQWPVISVINLQLYKKL
jgi:hypothetical protein